MTKHFESSTGGGFHAVIGMPDGHIFIRDIPADEKHAWEVILNDLLNAQPYADGGSVEAAMSWFEDQGFTKTSFENRPAIMSTIPLEVAERLELDVNVVATGLALDVTADGTPLESLTISQLREQIEAHGGTVEGLSKKTEFVEAARAAIQAYAANPQPVTPSEEAKPDSATPQPGTASAETQPANPQPVTPSEEAKPKRSN